MAGDFIISPGTQSENARKAAPSYERKRNRESRECDWYWKREPGCQMQGIAANVSAQ